jgi:glycosyltransferase involved in cell wall biosynthesis
MVRQHASAKILTVFIPSYNRARSLSRALDSVFEAVEQSHYANLVKVLVVDDYSSEAIEEVIAEQRRKGHAIDFRLHRKKCGVAEIAMLSCLEFIDTKYAWLLGNDDMLMPHAIDRVMEFLLADTSSFFLLNFVGREKDGSDYEYYRSGEKVFEFSTGLELFRNFGFATATTTFPCLCFEVAPLRSQDLQRLMNISPIYSHTFALFSAFHDARCSFVPEPLVVFNHNAMEEEQTKLESKNRLFEKTAFYHASLGFVRHLNNVSESLNIPLQELARFREDELNKNTKRVVPTLAGFFAFNFSIAQLCYAELWASINGQRNTTYTSRAAIEALQSFFDSIEIPELARYFHYARGVYCSETVSAVEKATELATIQNQGCRLAAEYVRRIEKSHEGMPVLALPFGGKKVLASTRKDDVSVRPAARPLRKAAA